MINLNSPPIRCICKFHTDRYVELGSDMAVSENSIHMEMIFMDRARRYISRTWTGNNIDGRQGLETIYMDMEREIMDMGEVTFFRLHSWWVGCIIGRRI